MLALLGRQDASGVVGVADLPVSGGQLLVGLRGVAGMLPYPRHRMLHRRVVEIAGLVEGAVASRALLDAWCFVITGSLVRRPAT